MSLSHGSCSTAAEIYLHKIKIITNSKRRICLIALYGEITLSNSVFKPKLLLIVLKTFQYLFEYFHSFSWNAKLSITIRRAVCLQNSAVFSLQQHSEIFGGYVECICFSSFFKESKLEHEEWQKFQNDSEVAKICLALTGLL